ncbi:hypothetical protein M422DRAFT_51580 [Sphaerobolus stellatus SS14]|uniref:Uncharacterized protein n=1 Tax=Sphaerobolus stellatus (strain SS14) TaxID=990650 RepID=A0A0C9V142_SPHS4|nr:hypothetical protein M422DRAFT_51580 [Sphaerobolus stellatus SS14]
MIQRISSYVCGPVTNLVWAAGQERSMALIFSLADGTIHFYQALKGNRFEVTIILCGHPWAVESIDYDRYHHRLATTSGSEVKLWDLTANWDATLRKTANKDGQTCRAIRFIDNGASLVVTFMETLKVIIWTIEPWKRISKRIFSLNPNNPCRAGYSHITSDGNYILIDNLRNGADAYSLSSGRHLTTFHAPLTNHKPRHIATDVSNSIAIQGSDKRIVYVTNFGTAAPIETLAHGKTNKPVQAVALFSQGSHRWIASGGAHNQPSMVIWKEDYGWDYMHICSSRSVLVLELCTLDVFSDELFCYLSMLCDI